MLAAFLSQVDMDRNLSPFSLLNLPNLLNLLIIIVIIDIIKTKKVPSLIHQ
jgi:hypothetical protein